MNYRRLVTSIIFGFAVIALGLAMGIIIIKALGIFGIYFVPYYILFPIAIIIVSWMIYSSDKDHD